ncbi:MAG: Methyltransferase [candidate division TM6 bacterium GW2011_GWF2_32_72]|nr:MAG: Methyltransferase [candidate division TM6 bacterium GW2011_GWF2_32_72]
MKKLLIMVILISCCNIYIKTISTYCPQNNKENEMKKNKTCCACANKKKNQTTDTAINKVYSDIAQGNISSFGGKSCGCKTKISQDIGYSREEIDALADANLGLGCGYPINLGDIQKGSTILDLGSGAGLDCFLAARKVGSTGKVIGVDASEAMVKKAQENKLKYGYSNVEFLLGDIENLPIQDNSIDIIISNCVLSLAKNKENAFKEAYRVLKTNGKMYVSDIVLIAPLSTEQQQDKSLIGTCALSAILKKDYLEKLSNTGFEIIISGEDTTVNITKYNNNNLPVVSLKYIAIKPN